MGTITDREVGIYNACISILFCGFRFFTQATQGLYSIAHKLLLIVPTHTGMAKLNWTGRLVTYQDGLPTHRCSPIQVLNWQSTAGILYHHTRHDMTCQTWQCRCSVFESCWQHCCFTDVHCSVVFQHWHHSGTFV